MQMHLISPAKSPVRLIRDNRELRQLHSPYDMFRETSGALSLDDISSVTVVAPYNSPERRVIWFLLGLAAGLFAAGSGADMLTLQIAASLPLAFAIVLAIIPNASSSSKVLLRLVSSDKAYMIAILREDVSAFRNELPMAAWKDEEEEVAHLPLNARERLRLRLMQIGLVMTMTSISSVAIIYIQQQPYLLQAQGLPSDVLIWFLRVAEIIALILFLACWIAIVRTGIKAREIKE